MSDYFKGMRLTPSVPVIGKKGYGSPRYVRNGTGRVHQSHLDHEDRMTLRGSAPQRRSDAQDRSEANRRKRATVRAARYTETDLETRRREEYALLRRLQGTLAEASVGGFHRDAAK